MTAGPAGWRRPRRTRQQHLVGTVLAGERRFLTARDVHEILSARGTSVGSSTVFRILRGLAEGAQVEVVTDESGQHRYLMNHSASHGHFLVCRRCGRPVRFEAGDLESSLALLASRHGFTALSHRIEVFGECPSCAASPGASATSGGASLKR